MHPILRTVSLTAAITFASAGIGFAADDDATPAKPVKCENGQIWDKKSKTCVTSDSNLIDDESRFEAARSFAYAGQYRHALTALASMGGPDEARVLNLQGYANRKLGNRDLAMSFYLAALEIDPNYLLARSYMGQALANEGKFDAARAQLAEISKRGGRESWAYVSLKQHLQTGNSY